MKAEKRQTFDLRLTDCGNADDGDVIRRVRSLLKRALRGHALRCTSVVEVRADGTSTAVPTAPAPSPYEPVHD